MGESHPVGRVILSVFSGGAGGLGTQSGNLLEVACPDCSDCLLTWAQATSPMSSACLEVRPHAQSPEPKGEALHLYIWWLICPQNTLAHPHPTSYSEFPIPYPKIWRHVASIDPPLLLSLALYLFHFTFIHDFARCMLCSHNGGYQG